MARNAKRCGTDWETPESGNGFKWEHVSIEVLMDIRDELKRLNSLLHCSNFVGIPRTLRTISRKIPTRRKVKR